MLEVQKVEVEKGRRRRKNGRKRCKRKRGKEQMSFALRRVEK